MQKGESQGVVYLSCDFCPSEVERSDGQKIIAVEINEA